MFGDIAIYHDKNLKNIQKNYDILVKKKIKLEKYLDELQKKNICTIDNLEFFKQEQQIYNVKTDLSYVNEELNYCNKYNKNASIYISYIYVLAYNKSNILQKFIHKFNPCLYDNIFKYSKGKTIMCCGENNFSCVDITLGIYKCNICDIIKEIDMDFDEFNDKKNNSMRSNNYKRKNYYKEYIERIFLQRNKNVSNETIASISSKFDIKKYTITNGCILIQNIYPKLSKKDVIYIYNKIKYGDTINLDNDDKYLMIEMFLKINNIWNTVRSDRISFISYEYCIYKIIELMGLKYRPVLQLISISKISKNLFELDKYWAKICNILGWDFKPTYPSH